jgi:5-formyltetrahydrofolate cyclo-ligase
MHTETKTTIRRQCIKKRNALSKQVQDESAKALCKHIEALSVYQNAAHIALYQAIGAEISLTPLWRSAENSGKTCYMPVMIPNTNTLKFLPTTTKTPQKINQFQILEPHLPHADAIALETIDLMILPLVAFDTHGTRLGRGAGFYDKTLKHQKPNCLLGAAYACQQHALLTADDWDIPLDLIVTEKYTYWSTP